MKPVTKDSRASYRWPALTLLTLGVLALAAACGGSTVGDEAPRAPAAAPNQPVAPGVETATATTYDAHAASPTAAAPVRDATREPTATAASAPTPAAATETAGAAAPPGPPAPGRGVAYVGLTGPEPVLDPSRVPAGGFSDTIVRAVFSGLYRLTEDGPAPDLAISWEAGPDGLRHVFTIRDGATWSDGAPLTAEDARFGILRSLDPAVGSPGGDLLASVIRGAAAYRAGDADASSVGVLAVDERTLVIETTAPASFLPSILAGPAAFPEPRHVVTSDPGWADRAVPVSSGPLRVVNRVPGGSIVLARNPGYRGPGVAALDGVVFISLAADATRESREIPEIPGELLDLGAVDAVAGLAPPVALDDPPPTAGISAVVVPGVTGYSLRFDVSRPPFDNALARRAFASAIDRARLITETVATPARPVYTLAPARAVGAVDPADGRIGVDYGLQKARDLLVEAGYPEYFRLEPFTLVHEPNERDRAIAEGVAGAWRDAFGLIIPVAEAARTAGQSGDVWDAIDGPAVWLERWTGGYADADAWLRLLYRSDSPRNAGGYATAVFDAAVDRGATFTDPAARARSYRQAEKILVEIDVAAVPLFVEDRFAWEFDGIAGARSSAGEELLESWSVTPR